MSENSITTAVYQETAMVESLVGDRDMFSLPIEVSHGKNQRIRRAGYSPYMRTFGKEIELPEQMLSDEKKITLLNLTEHEEFARRARMRFLAGQADILSSVKKASLRQSTPFRGEFEPGMACGYWRDARKKKGKVLPAGNIRCTVIGPEKNETDTGPRSNLWVLAQGHPILVAKEQLQPLDDELPAPSTADVKELDELSKKPPAEGDELEADEEEPLPPCLPLAPLGAGASPSQLSLPSTTIRRDYDQAALGDGMEADNDSKRARIEDGTVFLCDPFSYDASFLNEPCECHKCETSGEIELTGDGKFRTRAEAKALEREVPWSCIPEHEEGDYQEALKKEWGIWVNLEAVEVLTKKASDAACAAADNSEKSNLSKRGHVDLCRANHT